MAGAMRRRTRRGGQRGGQRGGALVEAALVSSFLYVPLLLGLVVVGLGTINRLQLDQLVRDVGIMHARGVDFSTPIGRDLFVKLTKGSLFVAGGDPPAYNGTVIISTVRYVSETDCNSCSNVNTPVVTYRTVLGDPGLYNSRFASPGTIAGDGRVTNWRNDASARAPGILGFISGMQPGDEAFVAEGYMKTPGMSFPTINATTEVQSWAIF
jgi:hypothetical protein